jgi:type II secretory pathway component PulC
MGLGQELAKYQAIDAVHEENGVEEGDIIIAFNKYQLGESDEFKAIVQEQQTEIPKKV